MESQTKIGFTVNHLLGSSSQRIAQVCYSQDCLVYLCGCYLIFYSQYVEDQIGFLKHPSADISCICASPDGNYIAIADNRKQTSITVYFVEDIAEHPAEIKWQLKGHKHSIELMAFSPNGKYLVSLSNRDGTIFVWGNGERLSQNKVNKPINKILFDQTGDLISVGRGHFKLWKFADGEIVRRQQQDCWIMDAKSLYFGKKFSTKDFIDTAVYKGTILTLSTDGTLCIISKADEKVKWLDIMVQKTTSIEIYGELALCAGDSSVIKAINLQTLTLQAKFPKPPPYLKQNISQSQSIDINDNELFPKCIGIRRMGQFCVTLYQNRTMFLWKIDEKIFAVKSVLSHQKAITSVTLLDSIEGNISIFATTSQDKTVRIWNIYKKYYQQEEQNSHDRKQIRGSVDIAQKIGIKRNVYCKNLIRIIYCDSHQPILKVKMMSGENEHEKSILCISVQEFMMYSLHNFELTAHDYFDIKQRALSLQTRGDEIYVGFQSGLLRIYKVTDSLHKVRQFQFDSPIQSLALCGNLLVIGGRRKIFVHDQIKQMTVFQDKNVCSSDVSSNFIVYCTASAICIYSLQKKRSSTISFKHEIDEEQTATVVKSNSWLIIVLTSKSRIIVANFSQTIVYTEKMNQKVLDIDITEKGEIILGNSHGTITAMQIDSGEKFHKVEKRVKKWFEGNDMSWLDGSVWRSQNQLPVKESKQVKEVTPLAGSDSFRLDDKSIGFPSVELPNININYQSEKNKMSVFNPSTIVEQANKIYKDITGIMKQEERNSEVHAKSPRFQESLEEIKLSGMESRPRKRIFGDPVNESKADPNKQTLMRSPQLLMGNLVTSTYHQQGDSLEDDHPPVRNMNYNIKTEESLDSGYLEMEHVSFANFDENKHDSSFVRRSRTDDPVNLQELELQLNSKLYIGANRDRLQTIYNILDMEFAAENKKAKIQGKFKEMADAFSKFLDKELPD